MMPIAVSAEFVGLVFNGSADNKNLCSKANAGDPSNRGVTFGTEDISKLKTHLLTKINCPSACFNEEINVSVSDVISNIKITVVTKGTNMCTVTQNDPRAEDAKKDKRGCGAGEKPPTVTVHVPAVSALGTTYVEERTIKDKSRCDAAVSQLTDSLFNNMATKDVSGANADLDRLAALPTNAPGTTPAPLDPSQYRGILQAYGLGQTDANLVIANKPEVAEILARCVTSGCSPDELQNAAKEAGITLNKDVTDQVSRIHAQWREENPDMVAEAERTYGQQSRFSSVSDFDRARQAIACIESSCGNYNTVCDPRRNSGCSYDGAWGKYQVRGNNVPSWTYAYCGQAMNPSTFVNSPGCQEAVFEGEFGRYVAQCGYEGAALRWFTGTCTPRSTRSDGLGTSASGYLSKFQRYFSGGALPFGSTANIYTRGTYGVSPFSAVNPLGYNSTENYGLPYGQTIYSPQGTPLGFFGSSGFVSAPISPPPIQQPTQQPTPQSAQPTQPPTQVNPIPTQPPVTPPPAVATIIAQPRSVFRGDIVTVSWSSVGMRTDVPCQIFAGTSFIAQGNEGTRTFETKPVTDKTVTFTIKCASIGGQIIQQTASVDIR